MNIKLFLELLPELEIIAGKKGNKNNISEINSFDNPETLPWLKKNELIITTGYFFKDDSDFQKKIIETMSKIQCAGLIVKFDRYFTKIPDSMISIANELNFPLINCPIKYSLSDISSKFYYHFYLKQQNLLSETTSIHAKLSKCLNNNHGIDYVINLLSTYLNTKIKLVDNNLNFISSSINYANDMSDLLVELHQIKNKMDDQDNHLYKTKNVTIFPIDDADELKGFLIIHRTNMNDFDLNLAVHACSILTIKLNQSKLLLQKSEQQKNELLISLLKSTDTLTFPETLYTEVFDFTNQENYYVMIYKILPTAEDILDENYVVSKITQQIIKNFSKVFNSYNIRANYVNLNTSIIFVVRCRKKTKDLRNLEQLHKDIESVSTEYSDLPYNLCAGNVVESLIEIRNSYRNAKRTISLFDRNPQNKILYSNNYKLLLLLKENLADETKSNYVDQMLAPLINYKGKDDNVLLHTLQIFLESNMNALQAANTLFIHRNTLTYRLSKIEELLNLELDNPITLLQLNIALQLKNIT